MSTLLSMESQVDSNPEFALLTPAGWVLRNDNGTTPWVIKKGRLDCLCEDSFREAIRLHGPRRGTYIDIGAFIGDTIPYFLGAGFDVVAFEPQPDAFWCLHKNFPNLALFNCALGNGETVILPNTEGNMGGRMVSVSSAGVIARRLDDFGIGDVSFIKIDVEGFEPSVLEGAIKTLEQYNPTVMVEFNLRALREHGYTDKDITRQFSHHTAHEVYRYEESQWDVVYVPHAK